MTKPALCIHGHFYQPPRENPWTGLIDRQPSAAPAHDWNARISDECYRPNAEARILAADGLPDRIFNNYSRMSFDFGPTLLAYLAREQRDLYDALRAADRDSRARFGGHGAALAQSYSHAILPLANARDRGTEVRWGLRDFELRLGRRTEGLWLPEAAVDMATLEVLAEQGVRFTLLAPHQAARVRALRREPGQEPDQPRQQTPQQDQRHDQRGDRRESPRWDGWQTLGDTPGAVIDPHRPYRVFLGSGRSIDVFFYDGALAHAVAFGDAPRDGAAFLTMLEKASGAGASSLVHFATDGESYGHHRPFAEMALAWVLDSVERGCSALSLTVYAQQLERYPPTMEVQIHERTSWSCSHGIERWRSDCGCNAGRHQNGDQSWRGPLRLALDLLRDRLAAIFEEEAGALLRDPWQAREHFVELLVDRSPPGEEAFLARHTGRRLDEREGRRALELLDMQRHALLMYASCGWFFDDLADIEPTQALAHAAYAVELAGSLHGAAVERDFLDALAAARSRSGAGGDALLATVVRERKSAARALASAPSSR